MDKDIGWVCITASQIIHKGPCEIHDMVVEPQGSATGYITIYDGESATEPRVARIRYSAYESKFWSPRVPYKLKRGLYIEFSSNVGTVTVQSRAL